jgi:hypothetical protein
MIADRYNASQHNLHANQAGNAGDCTSGAQSSPPWRRLGRFYAATVLTGFVLNEIWEMAQMSAYVETARFCLLGGGLVAAQRKGLYDEPN